MQGVRIDGDGPGLAISAVGDSVHLFNEQRCELPGRGCDALTQFVVGKDAEFDSVDINPRRQLAESFGQTQGIGRPTPSQRSLKTTGTNQGRLTWCLRDLVEEDELKAQLEQAVNDFMRIYAV